jgi:hypothetical protein
LRQTAHSRIRNIQTWITSMSATTWMKSFWFSS